jgi:hypothetical protein
MAPRGPMPSIAHIVLYWIRREVETRELPPFEWFDWGEPECMACGTWRDEAEERPNWDPYMQIASRWRDSGLTRCHIVPFRFGGSNEPSNLVLMCNTCHAGHPDSLDPEDTFRYMKFRRLQRNAAITQLSAMAAAGHPGAIEVAERGKLLAEKMLDDMVGGNRD